MIDIVVNYRTSDEPLAAFLIDQALTARLGNDHVFRDHRAIRVGAEFPAEIWSAIQECRVLVAVIGTRWLDRDDGGNRRIDDPTDYVRREIAEALRRDVAVVPVLVGDATLPDATELPSDVEDLPLRQFRTLRFRGAEQDVERLADELVALIGAKAPSDDHAGPTPSPTVSNVFQAPVHAPRSVFGAVINNR
jgi:hypothetical protein